MPESDHASGAAPPAPRDDEIVAAIRRIVRAIDLHSRRLVDQHGLTGPQLATLRAAERLGGGSIGAVARAVHLSQPTVSGILDRLERRGLAERRRSDRDRRSVTVVVTSAGRHVLARSPSLLQDHFRDQLAQLHDWEQHWILAALQRIAAMMDAEGIEAAPVLETGPLSAPPAADGDEPVAGG